MTPKERKNQRINEFIFVYKKQDVIKCLSLHESMEQDNELKVKGWKHTSTIDPILFIQNLHNVRKIDTEL